MANKRSTNRVTVEHWRRCMGAGAVLLLAVFTGCAGNGPAPSPSAESEAASGGRAPVEALRAAAAEIERQVHDGNREPVLTNLEGLVVDTPEIRLAVRTRAARIGLINALRDAGYAWERPNGRLWMLVTDEYKKATSSRRRDIDAITVNGENGDRWAIYEGLIQANKLPQGVLNDIQRIFFDERRAFMSPGQIYQGPDGEQARIP